MRGQALVGRHICLAQQNRKSKLSDKMRWRKVNLVIYWNKLCLITSVDDNKEERKNKKVLRVWKTGEWAKRPPSSSTKRAKHKKGVFFREERSLFRVPWLQNAGAKMETQWNCDIQPCSEGQMSESSSFNLVPTEDALTGLPVLKVADMLAWC